MFRWSLPIVVALAGLAQAAAAEPLRLAYEAYAGGLHVMSFDVAVEERGAEYRVGSGMRTRGMADFFLGMKLDAQAIGRVEAGRFLPLRYQSQSKFGRRERSLTVEPRGDGLFFVQATPAREDDQERTPIPPGSLRGAVDPLTALLSASRVAAATGSCTHSQPVFDGRRRYDLVFADEGERVLAASRYSAFAGPARQCRIRQERIGGFIKESSDKEIGRESVLWIARPLAGAPPLPVRLELDTSWGWITIQLNEVAAAGESVRLARDPNAK